MVEKWQLPVNTRWVGRSTYCYEEIDSTNLEAVRLAEQGEAHGMVVVADRQYKGRGRRGRSWESSLKGKDICFTLLLRPKFRTDSMAGLTLVMALSVRQAIKDYCHLETGIKWPNDLVLQGKKICGILTELHSGKNQFSYIIVGVGVNVNREELPEEIENLATSLLIESGRSWDRKKLLVRILERFEQNYESYQRHLDMTELIAEYQACLVNIDRQVRILESGNEREGIARGINPAGELLVEMPDGTITAIYAGEVSVRGIYGYV